MGQNDEPTSGDSSDVTSAMPPSGGGGQTPPKPRMKSDARVMAPSLFTISFALMGCFWLVRALNIMLRTMFKKDISI